MKNFLLIVVLFFAARATFSQPVRARVGTTAIDHPDAWQYLLSLDDGSAVLLYTNADKTVFSVQKYDKDAALLFDKKLLELKVEKGGRIDISELIELNSSLVFFASVAGKKSLRFLKFTLNKQTGEKTGEEEVASYPDPDKKFLESKNYLFDLSKQEDAGVYHFLTFARTGENSSELRVFGYDDENRRISSVSKAVAKSYSVVNLIASVQEGKSYYCAMNYIQEIKRTSFANKQDLILYQFSDGAANELALKIDRTERPYSYIAGQFTVNRDKQVRLAISNCYTSIIENVNVDNPYISDVSVFGLAPGKLQIADQYTVDQRKLLEQYKDLSRIKAKDRISLFNFLVYFHTDPENRDELIFQSYSDKRNGSVLATSIEDIGVFDFGKTGAVLNARYFPLSWDGAQLFSFKYNLADRGRMPNASGFFSPLYITNHKHLHVVSHHQKTYLLYNDLIENLQATSRDAIKTFGRLRDATGTALVIDGNHAEKSLIINTGEQLYFDFSTTSFNPKSGRCSVILNKSKKFYVAHLDLK